MKLLDTLSNKSLIELVAADINLEVDTIFPYQAILLVGRK